MGEKDIKGHNVDAVTGATSSESRANNMPEHVRSIGTVQMAIGVY